MGQRRARPSCRHPLYASVSGQEADPFNPDCLQGYRSLARRKRRRVPSSRMVAASPRDRAAGQVGDGDLARLLICRQDDESAIAVTEADRNPRRRILKPEDQPGEQPLLLHRGAAARDGPDNVR